MANESNILSASIELSLRSIQKGAKAIQQTVDNVNSAADFAQVKNEFSSLANRVVQAATTIQTEISKITNTIDLSQVARNLQSLDTNVGKIVGSIDSYMEKMADSMADVNKVKLTEVQDQLTDLQNSIKRFSTLIQSEDFLKAFKSDDVQKASSALRDYATALKNIAAIDLSKLNSVLTGMGKDSEGSVIDLSPLAEQVRDFVDAMDGLTNVDRKITTLVNAIGKLAEFDGSVDGSAFSKLAKSLDEVAAKAIAARDAASGVDIRKALPDEQRLANLSSAAVGLLRAFQAVSGVKFENGKLANPKDITTFADIAEKLEDIKLNITVIGNRISAAITKGYDVSKVTTQADKALDTTKSKAEQLNDVLKALKNNTLTDDQVKNTKAFASAMSGAAKSIQSVIDMLLNMKNNADAALASTTKSAEALTNTQNKAKDTTSGNFIGNTSELEKAIGTIIKGLATVQNGSNKIKITVGRDIAAIAAALKALSDEKQLDKFAQKLNGLSDGQVEQLTESFKKLTKEMTDVGNAVTNTFAGKTVSEVNNAKQQVVSFVSVLDRFKSNIDSFIMVDPSDATAGFANFAAELEKIGTLITRIFTDYESYEAALSGCTIDVKGQATFAEHIRKLSTETTTATINVEDFKNALQDVNVSENALNRVVAQTSGSFSASIKEMFSTDPAAAFIQDTNKYISKFRDLSQTSLTKANGFFTGFQNSGDMKQFAVNLQAVAQTLAAFDTKKLSELVAALHDLFAVKNEETGFSKIESSLTDLQKTAEKLEEIKTALGATDGITLADSMSAKLSESMTANLRDGLNGIAQAISSMGEAITHLDPERLRVVMDTISQLLNNNQSNTQGEHLLSVIKENINSSGTNISNIGAQAEASGEQVNQLENRITRLHNLQVTYGKDGSVTGAVATGWNEANRSITQYYNTAAQITSQVIRGTANQKSAVDEIVSLYKSAGTLISQSFSAKDEDLAADLYDQAVEKINQAERAMDGLDDKRRNSAAILQAQTDATNAYVKAQAAAVQAYRDTTDKIAQKEADTEYKQSLAYEQDQIKGCIKALNEYHSLQKTQAKFKADSPEFATLQEQINRAKASYDSYSDTVRNSVAVQNAWAEAEQKTSDALDNLSAKQQSASQASNLSALISKTAEYWDLMAKAETATTNVDKDEYTRRAQNLDAEIRGILKKNSALAQEQSYIDAATEAQKRYAAAVNSNSVATRQKEYNQFLEEQWSYEKRRLTLENQSGKGTGAQRAARQAEINRLRQEEERIAQQVNSMDKTGLDTQTKLKQIQEQRVRLENDLSLKTGEVSEKLLNQIVQMAKTMIVARALRSIWTNAISYATEYFDKLNEIQIVTMQTDSQIEVLSQSYRNLARELQISSTDIATAAVEFWRQGLDEEETMSRTKWASMYAKITAQSFDEAATQITASTNSMGVSAQEVVDLFTYLGDASASSGAEIGTAMQKAAAAASAFGLDFKHLGAYIATVSETTRQDAASIGTAFNTIIARWHSIKKTGYTTNDDGTTTGANDISKALGDVLGINLFENGQWKDMAVVLDEIASKWNGLDAAQKSYIATTMAGTKQQNVFLALMGDMAKGAENGSRMYELLAGAMESAGTVTEKYEVWLDSVAAAQGNLNVSLERLYTTILDNETLKSFYTTMASLADNFASGMETGFGQVTKNVLVFSAAVGSAVLLVSKLVSVVKALRAAKGISDIAGILTGGKVALVVGTLAAITAGVVTLVGAYRNAHDEAQKLQELQEKQADITTNYSSLSKLQSEYTKLISITNRTQEEEAQLKEVWKKLQTFSPTLAMALSNVSGGMENQEGVTKALREELDRLAQSYNGVVTAANKLSIKQIMDAYRTDQKKYNSYDIINDPALSANIGRLYDSKSGQSAISTIGQLIPNMNDEHWWGKMSVTQIVNEITQAQYGVVENVRQALFSDKGLIEGTNLATKFVSQFVTAYKEALDASENDLDLSQFIIDAVQSSQNDEAADEAAKTYAQQLFESMFDSMKPMDWDNMDFGSQSLFESYFENMFTDGTIGTFIGIPNDLKQAVRDYQAIRKEADDLDVDIGKTIYGNIDTNNRQVLEWTEENLEAFKDAYESWGYTVDDLKGSISTVMGTSADYDGIEIAFTPILQTPEGAKLLDANTVDEYIWGLIDKANEDGSWTNEELFALDAEGLEIDGQIIKNLLADIGDEAIKTGEAMHYVGKDGALAQAFDELETLSVQYGVSIKDAVVGSAQDAGVTYIDQLVEAMKQGDETISGVMLKLLQGASEYTEKMLQTEWGANWIKALNAVNSKYGTDEFDSAYASLEVAYNALKEKYGDDFFVQLPSKESFGGVASGLADIGDAADDASTDVEKLSSKLAKVLANQTSDNELKALQNSNFKSWIDQLRSFINEDGTVDGSALFAWMHELDSSNLEKFLEVFPQFTAYLKEIAELGDNGGLSETGENLEGFSDAVANASDQMLVALNNYRESHSGVTDEDGKSLLSEFSNLMSIGEDGTLDGLDAYIEKFASASAEDQKWMLDNSDAILKFSTAWERYKKALDTGDTDAASSAMKDMKDAFSDLNREVADTHFDDVTKQIEKMTEATDSSAAVLSAYDKVYTMADNYAEAAQEYENLAKKYSSADQILYSDVSKIASVLSMSPQAVLQAWDQIPAMLQQYAQDGLSALDLLNQEAFFNITGTSSVDFSDLENGIVIVDNMAQEMLDTLIKTGQFEVETIPVNSVAKVWDSTVRDFVSRQVNGTYKVLKPTGNNPFSSGSHRKASTKSSGGGGGSGSKNNSSSKKDSSRTEEERWVEQVDNTVKRITDRMSQLNTIMNSWDSEGYFTAEIKALGQVNEMLEDQDKILREKIAEAQARLPALIDQFNSTTPDTEAYDAILSRVNTIQDAITDWTQKLTENEASIVSNKQKIDDLNDSIRQLKLDLENEILEAIEDREQRIDDMLQAKIDMEETILDILKAQAEDAEQAILDAIDAQIDALNKEKDAVSELLDARKEQADQEDKLAHLQELQAKYSRIVADPTRAKDAQDILDQISDLRDEIAWDQAENESEAQQKSIEQQISSLEDYRNYIEQYYEDLLNNPRNFIDQVNSILKMSQEDILTWLEQNSTDYKNSTDNTRTDMENGWKETLDTMNGIIHDHWQEVQDIISQGDEAVIAFLKENSSKYREASKLQQEAYIEGWQDMFDKIRKAYEDMQTNLLDNSKFINNTKWGGSDDDGSSGGSSGGGGGRGSSTNAGGNWYWSLNGSKVGQAYSSKAAAQEALNQSIAYAKKLYEAAAKRWQKTHSSADLSEMTRLSKSYNTQKKATVKKFARGGIADFTGPIQIDGTKANPERILSATQTKLFEGLVASLEQMNRVRVAPMKYNGETITNNKSYGYNFGDINIKVERLDSDRDIEDLADKVKESIVESMTRGRAVGGIAL
jgi:TP901 family phage tail tape measure protein